MLIPIADDNRYGGSKASVRRRREVLLWHEYYRLDLLYKAAKHGLFVSALGILDNMGTLQSHRQAREYGEENRSISESF
jgi:hypothetical protein